MNDVEKLIAKLIDEHKITGEEAIVLIKNCKSSDHANITDDSNGKFDCLWKSKSTAQTVSNSNVKWDNGSFVRDLGNGISIAQ